MTKVASAAVLGLAAALATGVLVTHVRATPPPAGPVYTVAQVAAGLARHPWSWYGRTITVRGVALLAQWSTPLGTMSGTCDVTSGCPITVSHAVVQGGMLARLYVLDRLPQRAAASRKLAHTLMFARRRWPVTMAVPPNLVLLVLPGNIQPASSPFADVLQRMLHVPAPVASGLVRLTFIFTPSPLALDGASRLYRVRLHPPPGPLAGNSRVICDPACDDAFLFHSLN